MTLLKLKKNIKAVSLLAFLVVYAAGFFTLGRIADFKIKNPINFGSKETSNLNLPVQNSKVEARPQQGDVIASYVKLCSNTVYSFEIAYPKDWFTTYNEEDQRCRFFAPYSFIVPQDTNTQFVPITIEAASPTSWPQTVKFYENPNDFQNVILKEDIEIGGRQVKKIVAKTTGEGSLPKNFDKISYLIYNSTSPLVITYMQTELEEDFGKMESALEEMVSSVRFF